MKVRQEITVDHLARIEGKAGIEVDISEDSVEAKLNVTEGPRFFEVITKNKHWREAVTIFPRICSFCCTPHKLTPIEAVERALDVEPTEQTRLLRELLYLGNILESHALHLYLLVVPDYLGYPDAFAVSEQQSGLVEDGIFLKDIGAEIQSSLGSRSIHPESALVGGFGTLPGREKMQEIRDMADRGIAMAERAVDFFAEYEYPSYVDSERRHLSIACPDSYSVYGDEIVSSDGDSFKVEDYIYHLQEHVAPYSFAKRGSYKDEPYMVGAQSRLINGCDRLTGRAAELLEQHRALVTPDNPFANNFAQVIEMVYFLERIKELIDEIGTPEQQEPVEPTRSTGEGYAVTEAPRGLLIYYLNIEDDQVVDADVITPTAMFLPMMEVDIADMATGLWQDGCQDEETIADKVEMVSRAYDPCISCSVHVTRL